MKAQIVNTLLLALALVAGIYIGGGIFEMVINVPIWTASAEAARNWNENTIYNFESGRFFIVTNPLTTLLALLTLIFGWNSPRPARFWLRLGTTIIIVMFVTTMIYFVPEQLALKGRQATVALSDAEIMSRTARWAALNYLRAGAELVGFFSVLKALSLYGRGDLEERLFTPSSN